MAKEEKNLNQENQEPEKIDEETTLAMVQVPWWKKMLNGGKYALFLAFGYGLKVLKDHIFKGGNDDDSGNDASESDE
jgi:hypothetical protein